MSPAPADAGRLLSLARLSLLASALVVGLWAIWQPATADLAAQVYRTELYERVGWTLWDNNWFGGHHLPGYSLLTPQLMAALGVGLCGAAAAVTTTAAFSVLIRGRERWVWATAWVAWSAAADLVVGRVTYAVGQALAVLAVLALTRDRRAGACALAALAAAASPVAGVFLGLAALVWWSADRRPEILGVGASAGAVVLVTAVLFGDGGSQPYATSSALLALAIAGALWCAVAVEEKLIRGALLGYVMAVVAAWALPTPMGSNVARLGVTFAVPLVLVARRRLPAAYVFAVAAAATVWLAYAPATELLKTVDAPETHARFYAPLLAELDRRGAQGRVEVVPSATRWESVFVAAHQPLARGWETQLDRARNALFYEPGLTARRYTRWLRTNAVTHVALSRAPKERWGVAEERLLRRGVPGLRVAWRSRDWTLYDVRSPQPLATGARLLHLGTAGVLLDVPAPRTVVLRVRFSPAWVASGGACVSPRPDGFMDIAVKRAGRVRLRLKPTLGSLDGSAC